MGKLRYDSTLPSIVIEDVELAHLKVVIGTKLRRQESFMMTWHPPGGDPGLICSAWIHPAIPLQFAFEAEPIPQVSPTHVAELMERLNATGDLLLAHVRQ